jgi:hypothetical protein
VCARGSWLVCMGCVSQSHKPKTYSCRMRLQTDFKVYTYIPLNSTIFPFMFVFVLSVPSSLLSWHTILPSMVSFICVTVRFCSILLDRFMILVMRFWPPQLASPQVSICGWLCWDAQRAIPDWMLRYVDGPLRHGFGQFRVDCPKYHYIVLDYLDWPVEWNQISSVAIQFFLRLSTCCRKSCWC